MFFITRGRSSSDKHLVYPFFPRVSRQKMDVLTFHYTRVYIIASHVAPCFLEKKTSKHLVKKLLVILLICLFSLIQIVYSKLFSLQTSYLILKIKRDDFPTYAIAHYKCSPLPPSKNTPSFNGNNNH